jgi:hypothetical protein
MNLTSPSSDTAGTDYTLTVEITNDKTGHNVPTGVPFNRQMWLSIIVKDDAQNIVYSSGQLDANNDLMDDNSEYPERDSALFQTKATLFRKNGSHADGTWDAASIVNETIAPYETRVVDYIFTIPNGLSGNLTAEVILRYRSFPPHLVRSIGLQELLPLPIIDMNIDTLNITIL